jgi:hypothetical protein
MDGMDVLDAPSSALRRFVVIDHAPCTAVALWILHAHAHDAFAIWRGRLRLRAVQNARHPEWHGFLGRIPTAHSLACLRIADPVTETVARLATGSGGLTPGRAGFAPAGRRIKFHEVIAPPFPFDQQSLVALNGLSPGERAESRYERDEHFEPLFNAAMGT